MKNADQVWLELAAASRGSKLPPIPSVPYGFSGRVVARWLANPAEDAAELWMLFGRRGVFGAATVMLMLVALNYYGLSGLWDTLLGVEPFFDVLHAL
ncbi:MAG: hypothetical protein WCO56_06745 [Verrucomicrobiota bacterium]